MISYIGFNGENYSGYKGFDNETDESIVHYTADLALVHHLYDQSDKNYLFKAPPKSLNVGDLVDTKIEGTNKTLARVIDVYRNILIPSAEYNFICKVAKIDEIKSTIVCRYVKEEF